MAPLTLVKRPATFDLEPPSREPETTGAETRIEPEAAEYAHAWLDARAPRSWDATSTGRESRASSLWGLTLFEATSTTGEAREVERRPPDLLPDSLLAMYQIPNRDDITQRIARSHDLRWLFDRAPAEIRKYFPDAVLSLVVATDPEIEDDHVLSVVIATRMAPDQALDAYGELEERWWLGATTGLAEELYLHLEFV